MYLAALRLHGISGNTSGYNLVPMPNVTYPSDPERGSYVSRLPPRFSYCKRQKLGQRISQWQTRAQKNVSRNTYGGIWLLPNHLLEQSSSTLSCQKYGLDPQFNSTFYRQQAVFSATQIVVQCTSESRKPTALASSVERG